MTTEFYFWIAFPIFIILMLAIDLGVFHRKSHAVSFKESLAWTVVWIGLAMLFNVIVISGKALKNPLSFSPGMLLNYP